MFKTRLRDLRIKNKLTQKELANDLHLQNTAISKYEIGDRNPDQKTLIKIAEYFNVSLDYLLGVSNIENPYKEKNYDETDEFIADFKSKVEERSIKLNKKSVDDLLDLYQFIQKENIK